MQRTLSLGLTGGLATGLGAATVHLAFGSIAALGFAETAARLGTGARWMTLISAGLLFWFAARIFRRTAVAAVEQPRPAQWVRCYGSALLFGLSNPLTVLLFVAAIPALTATADLHKAPLLVTGVFLGSLGWWVVLSTTVALVRGRLSPSAIALTNRATGVTLAMLGTLMLASSFGLDWRSSLFM